MKLAVVASLALHLAGLAVIPTRNAEDTDFAAATEGAALVAQVTNAPACKCDLEISATECAPGSVQH